jgi:hypothetical protein
MLILTQSDFELQFKGSIMFLFCQLWKESHIHCFLFILLVIWFSSRFKHWAATQLIYLLTWLWVKVSDFCPNNTTKSQALWLPTCMARLFLKATFFLIYSPSSLMSLLPTAKTNQGIEKRTVQKERCLYLLTIHYTRAIWQAFHIHHIIWFS